MKRFFLIIIFTLMAMLPSRAEGILEKFTKSEVPNIFIYHIPDYEDKNSEQTEPSFAPDIVSDDVTADTSGVIEETEEDFEPEYIERITIDENGYEIDDMYSDVLKGYASYDENEKEAILLENNPQKRLSVNIQQPYCYKGGKYLPVKNFFPPNYSKYSTMEYSITPLSSSHSKKLGSFTAGTMFNQGIDYAEIEQSTGVYSRYDTKYFGVYTAYSKTVNSTNNNYNDNIYFSPELKLNQYFTLKEILSADITNNRKKAELVFSINPFGKKDLDRIRLEFGANATYDDSNALLKNQFKFSTKFKF